MVHQQAITDAETLIQARVAIETFENSTSFTCWPRKSNRCGFHDP